MTTYLGVWFVVFGVMLFNTPLSMEGGVVAFQERIGGTLCSPVLGIMGLPTFVGGNHPSTLINIGAVAVSLGTAVFIFFRCRTWKGYWVWFVLHCLLVVASTIGFHRLTIY